MHHQIMRALPQLTSLKDVLDLIATTVPCEDAAPYYNPPHGWHTITVSNVGDEAEPSALRTWVRLFDLYSENRPGTVIWKHVLHLDREKREIAATFCIDHSEHK